MQEASDLFLHLSMHRSVHFAVEAKQKYTNFDFTFLTYISDFSLVLVLYGLRSNSAISRLYSDGTVIQFANLDLLPDIHGQLAAFLFQLLLPLLSMYVLGTCITFHSLIMMASLYVTVHILRHTFISTIKRRYMCHILLVSFTIDCIQITRCIVCSYLFTVLYNVCTRLNRR